MSHPSRCLLLAIFFGLALPARAKNPPAPDARNEPPRPALPDAVLRAAVNRPVMLELTAGPELAARILAVEPEFLIISVSADGQVRILPRASVAAVRLLPAAPLAAPTRDHEPASAAGESPPPRYLAASVSLAPGFNLDLDAGLFHGFATLGVILPLATKGNVIPFALGLGVGVPVSSNRAFKLDFFAHLVVVGDAQGNLSDYGAGFGNWVGVGAGLGFHYTWNNGVTLGLTVPLLGCSFLVGESDSSGRFDLGQGVALYFLTSATALPLFYLGYRM